MQIEEYERRFVEAFKGPIAERLDEDDGVTVDDVRFETSAGETNLVVMFSHKDRPDCRFGYRGYKLFGAALPDKDPEYVASYVLIDFQEDVQPGYVLRAECSPGETVWFDAWRRVPRPRPPG